MKHVLLLGILLVTLFLGSLWLLNHMFPNNTLEISLTLLGHFLVASTVIFLWYQIKSSLDYNKRKSAMDFSYQKITNELFPMVRGLASVIKKEFRDFVKDEPLSDLLKSNKLSEDEKKQLRKAVLDILNFYERMSIGILKKVYDEDICYDDNGYDLLRFYGWVRTFIRDLQIEYNEERLFVNFEDIAHRWDKRYRSRKNRYLKQTAVLRRKNTIQGKDI